MPEGSCTFAVAFAVWDLRGAFLGRVAYVLRSVMLTKFLGGVQGLAALLALKRLSSRLLWLM